MKKFFSVIILTMGLTLFKAHACDICGCGVNNYYIGILPQFNHTFFGLRYHVSAYRTRIIDDPTQFSKDFYQTAELWGGWNISDRLQVLAFVPYNYNHQHSDDGISARHGIGDVRALVNYKLIDLRSTNGHDRVVSQQLWIGGGVKLATGKFEVEPNDPDVAAAANGQLGSGTTDLLLNAMYNVHVGKLGISTTAGYKLNGVNKDDFRFGNKFSAGSFVYSAIRVSHITINPNAGLLYESTKESQLQNKKIDLTSGSILRGSLGAEINFGKLATGFNVQVPVTQNFAGNQTKERIQATVHVSVAI